MSDHPRCPTCDAEALASEVVAEPRDEEAEAREIRFAVRMAMREAENPAEERPLEIVRGPCGITVGETVLYMPDDRDVASVFGWRDHEARHNAWAALVTHISADGIAHLRVYPPRPCVSSVIIDFASYEPTLTRGCWTPRPTTP